MARLSLKSMRESVKSKAPGGNYDSEFWTPMDNLDMNGSATLRFVPFIDDISGGFWTIQKTLTATFVNPDDDNEKWYVKIPCLEMYSNEVKCPVTDVVRSVFKEADELIKGGNTDEGEGLKSIALSHWIRYSYLLEGFVVNGGNKTIADDQLVPFRLPKSMFSIIQDSVVSDDSEFDELPCGSFDETDLQALMDGELPDGMDQGEFAALFNGRGFVAKKTKKDKYNNYDSSTWSMKEHEMTDEQISAIAENGFIDLRKFLPKQPSDEMYEVYTEIMQISIDAALGSADNTWNPEWEEKYGIKPIKPKNKDGESSGGDVKSKLKSKLGSKNKGSDDGESKPRTSTSASDLRSKLNKSRGKKVDEDAGEDSSVSEDAANDDNASDDADEKPSTDSKSRVSSLSERLKAKTQAAKANA